MSEKIRCPWVNLENKLYVAYHDQEWGKPVHDEHKHFELLTLEGAQAGLSWEIILKKRVDYRQLFANFDPNQVAKFSNKKIQRILQNPGIVRNKLKVESTVSNAKAFLAIQKAFGSFDQYIWAFVDHKPIQHKLKTLKDYPSQTLLSDKIAKDLKTKGFRFVGSKIIYAYLQAAGLVNDHTQDCFTNNWSVYMIRCRDNTLYTGVALDVQKRFQAHCAQKRQCAKYLKGKEPLKLVYQKRIGTRSEAMRFEYQLKQYTKLEKEALITK